MILRGIGCARLFLALRKLSTIFHQVFSSVSVSVSVSVYWQRISWSINQPKPTSRRVPGTLYIYFILYSVHSGVKARVASSFVGIMCKVMLDA